MENHLRTALDTGTFFCSAELVMGRDHDIPDAEAFVRDAAQEPNGVRIISATDLPGGNPALPPEAFVSFVSENGLTSLAHISGKDGNRSFLEGRLHGLAHLGVESILALTGDGHHEAFAGMPKPVFDLDSVLILTLIEKMKEGVEYQVGPRAVQTTPFDFLAGAVVGPYKTTEPDQMMQYYKLELKIAAGAQFIITQLGYNLRKLYELRQYMAREGLGHIPVIANVYVPTATVAKMMRRGDLAGCVVSDELITRLEGEKKPRRLERAGLMVAAARELGFAGAHVGGFVLKHKDVMKVLEHAEEVGSGWRSHMDDLVFDYPGEFYLFPEGSDGLSDGEADYQLNRKNPSKGFGQRVSGMVAGLVSHEGSLGTRVLKPNTDGVKDPVADKSWRGGLRYRLMGLSDIYRRNAWNCVQCGDCIQDHLNYPGCTMSLCYKELRNGPCGGSRVDGTCEVNPAQPCVWSDVYLNTLAAGEDPRKYARTLVPGRNWALDQTSALSNRLAGLDGFSGHKPVTVQAPKEAE